MPVYKATSSRGAGTLAMALVLCVAVAQAARTTSNDVELVVDDAHGPSYGQPWLQSALRYLGLSGTWGPQANVVCDLRAPPNDTCGSDPWDCKCPSGLKCQSEGGMCRLTAGVTLPDRISKDTSTYRISWGAKVLQLSSARGPISCGNFERVVSSNVEAPYWYFSGGDAGYGCGSRQSKVFFTPKPDQNAYVIDSDSESPRCTYNFWVSGPLAPLSEGFYGDTGFWGVNTSRKIVTRSTLNDVPGVTWDLYDTPADTNEFSSVVQLRNGSMYAVTPGHAMYRKETPSAPWVEFPPGHRMLQVSVRKDGTTLVGTGTDYYVYTMAKGTNAWSLLPSGYCCMFSVVEADDGTTWGAAGSKPACLWKKPAFDAPHWTVVDCDVSIASLAVTPKGQLVGIDPFGAMWWRNLNDGAKWAKLDYAGGVLGLAARYAYLRN